MIDLSNVTLKKTETPSGIRYHACLEMRVEAHIQNADLDSQQDIRVFEENLLQKMKEEMWRGCYKDLHEPFKQLAINSAKASPDGKIDDVFGKIFDLLKTSNA